MGGTQHSASAASSEPVVLRILTPSATPEEVAAVVALFSALGTAAPVPPRRRSLWSDPAHRVRARLSAGPGAWRASGLPY